MPKKQRRNRWLRDYIDVDHRLASLILRFGQRKLSQRRQDRHENWGERLCVLCEKWSKPKINALLEWRSLKYRPSGATVIFWGEREDGYRKGRCSEDS